ncbi:MAG: phosphoribosylanthranilate isomerase [Chitinophagia bacterium]|jgi:phosphoribosylanthranilate isomerase
MRIKVCGMTMLAQLKELEECGIDFAGLIFYERSPRFVLKGGLTPEIMRKEGIRINRVGVFVNEAIENVLTAVEDWKLDLVQLHGDESPRYCEQVSNHVNTIKAFRIGKDENIPYKIRPYQEAADLYLFDTLGQQLGGTGEKFDWKLISKAAVSKPYFLSGGISLEDADEIKAFASGENKLFSLDINSKFEVSPGKKDMDKIRKFAKQVKNYQ